MAGAAGARLPALKLVHQPRRQLGHPVLFRHGYNDTTNAFKAYRREVIHTVQPLLSNHFNLTVELPLKAVVRGHSFAVVPISWTNRAAGESKLALNEMGCALPLHRAVRVPREASVRGDYVAGPPRAPGAAPRPARAARRGSGGAYASGAAITPLGDRHPHQRRRGPARDADRPADREPAAGRDPAARADGPRHGDAGARASTTPSSGTTPTRSS